MIWFVLLAVLLVWLFGSTAMFMWIFWGRKR
jgi:hypothetical protein